MSSVVFPGCGASLGCDPSGVGVQRGMVHPQVVVLCWVCCAGGRHLSYMCCFVYGFGGEVCSVGGQGSAGLWVVCVLTA